MGHFFCPLQPMIQIMTDASITGWGAHCNNLRIHDTWSHTEKTLHNLELLAIFKVLKASEPLVTSNIVQITTDNTSALFYLNKQGSTHSLPLLYLTVQIWEWCLECHIFPMVVYVAAHDNTVADKLSRLQTKMHK